MADEAIVMDSGPLILLAKIDALAILESIPLRYVAPTAVHDELTLGLLYGHPPVTVAWLEIIPPSSPVPAYITATLDEGEAAVIHLAFEQNIGLVCLDDRRGRNMAKALGLQVVGLLGLLVRAKRLGVISAIGPYTSRLVLAGARYSPSLLKKVLSDVGE